MDNPINQIQDTIRQMWYSETNSGESTQLEGQFFQQCVNLVPTFVHDTFLPYGRPREQVLEKRDGLTCLVTGASASLQWASFLGANAPGVVVLDAIPITAVYDVIVVACYDPIGNANYIVQVRPITGTATVIGNPAIAKGDQLFLTEISQVSSGNLVPGVAVCQSSTGKTVGAGYYAVTSGGVFSVSSLITITDTGFPANQTPALIPTGRFQQLNGVTYIASVDGQIWNSSTFPINDISIWKDANGDLMVASASFYPDQLVGLERYKNHIVAFGTNSIEFFDNQGNSPSPLGVLDQATIKFGAISPILIKNLNDQLYWVAYGTEGVTGLWTLDGYTPTKISTPYIDYLMSNTLSGGLIPQLTGGTINSRAHIFVNGLESLNIVNSITLPGSSDTYPPDNPPENTGQIQCYNIVDQTWWSMNCYTQFQVGIMPVTGFPNPSINASEYYTQYVLLLSHNAGSPRPDYLYAFWTAGDGTTKFGDVDPRSAFFPGNIDPISIYVQCNPLWFTNEKRKKVSRFKLIRDGFVPIAGDNNVYAGYFIYNRDNDMTSTGAANSFVRRVVLPPQTNRYYINNLGTGRMWTFGYFEKTLSPTRIHSYEIDVQQNSH